MAGSLLVNTINTDTVGGVFTTQNAVTGIAKAWVFLSGSATAPTINGSFNVSSITRNGTGDYYINFTTAMANANYAAVVNGGIDVANANFTTGMAYTWNTAPYYQAPTTTQVRVLWVNSSGVPKDPYYGAISVFGA